MKRKKQEAKFWRRKWYNMAKHANNLKTANAALRAALVQIHDRLAVAIDCYEQVGSIVFELEYLTDFMSRIRLTLAAIDAALKDE